MLESTKATLQEFINWVRTEPTGQAIERLQVDGPAYCIQVMLDGKRKSELPQSFYDDLVEHREECERYFAGLLGMM